MKRAKVTAKDLINESILILKKHKIKEAKLNAELIMSHCMNGDRIDLYENYNKYLTKIEQNLFRSLIRRRIKKEPVQYIIGKTEFMGLKFKVNKNVLIPRPDTETLVEFAIKYSLENKINSKYRILDYGTGSGNIIISIAKYSPNLQYYAIDLSREALILAKENAKSNRVDKDIFFVQSNGFSSFNSRFKFDMIVSNPPYIPTSVIRKLPEEIKSFEPLISLDGGEDGLKVIKDIVSNAYRHLKKNGVCLIEIGYEQSESVEKMIKEVAKYKDIKFLKDLAGIKRVVFFKKK
ncbi:MAG: peptide chain release factor N(5)-glutamine methyltransferase [bacterium]|uniref:Release factor glutamine methyltransferase n=1 Tax=candidate division TA06 bacterium 34_109 TaxID=1635277 RepID=A0A101HYX6_UNCT6|nr:MAG: Release factor glutamine methyltransferase [candidate division TA06 bacterium 32_111]KUK85937.1 MAG: Release factor glutamine methyltransferase [candidate division TA06 bacterium 34_109]MDI6701340.1 peptide chain release factor N(5)-glutamine methyltransferase [bacterium]HCP16479.1 peptide chain release factor N(5)-glutamine methyltransferase [candidate division WOR-3 bacterium]